MLVMLTALVVLCLGWIGGVELAVRLWPNYAAMVPSTATLFLLFSASLLLYLRRLRGNLTLRVPALVGLAIALTDIALGLTGASAGIDALFWPDQPIFEKDRMALATALCFLLLGVAFLTLPSQRAHHPIFVITATLGWSLSGIALIGYMFDAEELYAVSLFTAMALHTSICFVALFTAVLFARPDRGWMRILMGRGEGSRGARRLMPFVILVPLTLCLAVLIGTRQGWYGPDFRLSLLAILIMTLLAASVLYNASIENRTNRKLMGTLNRLEKTAADKDLLLGEVYHRVKNNLQQIAALIRLEARELPEDDRAPLNALSNRVRALAQVHELLVERPSISSVGLDEFITSLCEGLLSATVPSVSGVGCHVHVEDREVDIDFAIKLGLLVNELLTNSLKHAFAEEKGGELEVHCTTTNDGGLLLRVQDDGKAAPSRDPAGVGQRIVDAFVKSVGGEMRTEYDRGRNVLVRVPAEMVC